MNGVSPLLFDSTNDACWLVTLNAPKGNIIDTSMIRALTDVVIRAAETQRLKAIIFTGAGPHFSFGASVKEHQPGEVETLLPAFHDLIRRTFECGVFTIAAVRGQCLGGGLELASACHRIVASPDAHFGQPEILLGVFAPAGSVLLPERIGRARAEDLCLTGRIIGSVEALRIGLVDDLADNPVESALKYTNDHLSKLSASTLRHAVRAVRLPLAQRFNETIQQLEHRYLNDLMKTADAKEGISAFLEKRTAKWRDA